MVDVPELQKIPRYMMSISTSQRVSFSQKQLLCVSPFGTGSLKGDGVDQGQTTDERLTLRHRLAIAGSNTRKV